MCSYSSIMAMRLGSTTAIASTSHESIYAVMHVAYLTFQALSDVPHGIRSYLTRHELFHPRPASVCAAFPHVHDRCRIRPLDMDMTSDNGNFSCEEYYHCRGSSYWPFLEALFAFIVAQRQPHNIHRTPLSALIDQMADYGTKLRSAVRGTF